MGQLVKMVSVVTDMQFRDDYGAIAGSFLARLSLSPLSIYSPIKRNDETKRCFPVVQFSQTDAFGGAIYVA